MFFQIQAFPTEKSQILSGFFWFPKKAKGVQKKPEFQKSGFKKLKLATLREAPDTLSASAQFHPLPAEAGCETC